MTAGIRQHFPTIIHQAGSRHDFTRHTQPETVTPSKQRCTAEHAESITATTQDRQRPGSHRKPDGIHSAIQAATSPTERRKQHNRINGHTAHRNAHRAPRRAGSDAERQKAINHDGSTTRNRRRPEAVKESNRKPKQPSRTILL